jgi:hypothetical protein
VRRVLGMLVVVVGLALACTERAGADEYNAAENRLASGSGIETSPWDGLWTPYVGVLLVGTVLGLVAARAQRERRPPKPSRRVIEAARW